MNLDTMFSTAFYANFVFDDPNWKVSQFNFDTDVSTADAKIGSVLNADDPDLKGFLDRHGKLIQYHGWNDGALPPRHSIKYFAAVADKMGGVDKTQQFYRLFMAPGVMHCGQGTGPDEFGNVFDLVPSTDATHNVFLALQEWVEKNIAPDKIIATRYKKDNDPTSGLGMTRPLCPYPKEAMWEGQGDTSDAATWSCSTPTETKARK